MKIMKTFQFRKGLVFVNLACSLALKHESKDHNIDSSVKFYAVKPHHSEKYLINLDEFLDRAPTDEDENLNYDDSNDEYVYFEDDDNEVSGNFDDPQKQPILKQNHQGYHWGNTNSKHHLASKKSIRGEKYDKLIESYGAGDDEMVPLYIDNRADEFDDDYRDKYQMDQGENGENYDFDDGGDDYYYDNDDASNNHGHEFEENAIDYAPGSTSYNQKYLTTLTKKSGNSGPHITKDPSHGQKPKKIKIKFVVKNKKQRRFRSKRRLKSANPTFNNIRNALGRQRHYKKYHTHRGHRDFRPSISDAIVNSLAGISKKWSMGYNKWRKFARDQNQAVYRK